MAVDTTKHHISILRQDGSTEVPMMLATEKDKEGHDVPIYWTSDDDYIADPIRGQSNPNKELPPFIQDDWRGGFGLKFADPSDPHRYHYGTNIDMRFRNEGRCGPLATSVTKPTVTTPTIANTDMESNSDWLNGAANGGEQSDTQAHDGSTYSWKVNQAASGPTVASDVYQDIHGANITNYQGRTFAIECYVWNDVANGKIFIDDGINARTYSSNHTGSSSWELLTVRHTLASNASQLRIGFYNNGTANVNYYDDITLTEYPQVGTIACQADFNSKRYASYGNILLLKNSGGTAYTYVNSFPATITDLLPTSVGGTDYLIICLGWSDKYWYMIADETCTENAKANNTIKYMASDGTTWWGSQTNSTLMTTTHPISTDWATSKQIGEDAFDIVDLIVFGGLPYIKKNDCKVYYLDSSSNVQTLINGQENLGGDNSARMFVWRESSLLIPYGKQDLIHYDGTDLTYISPSLYSTGAGDFIGQVQAITGDGHYLYVILDDGADVQLMAVRKETVGGVTDWRWHPLAKLTTITGCASLGLTSVDKKRLWVGSSNSANNFTWYPVTTKYGDIDSDTDYKYQTNGYLYTSWLDLGYRGDIKAFIKQVLTFSHTYNADIYLSVYYRLWGETSFTNAVGSFDGSSGVRTETKYIDVASKPASTFIQFRIQFKTNDVAKTPILNISDLRAILYPSRRNIIHCIVRCADNIIDKKGGALGVTAATIRDTLIEAKNTATYPVTFYDINGDTKYVRFLPVNPYSKVNKDEKGRNIEEWYYLEMMEVTLS